jgi:branched-chain amino acid transport system substrate-binding protein
MGVPIVQEEFVVSLTAPRGRRRWSVVPIALALSLALAACGDDDAASDNDTASSTTEASDGPDLTGSAQVMVIAPITDPTSGGAGAYPEVLSGARAAAEVINAQGGINGTGIEVVECDTTRDANEAFTCAQRAVNEGFLAVVAAQDRAGNYLEPLREAGIPNVAPFAATPDLGDPNSYPVFSGTLGYLLGGLTGLAGLDDVQSIAVAYVEDGSPLGAQLEQLAGAIAPAFPDVDVNFVGVSLTQADYSVTVTTAAESDAVYLAMPPDAIVQFLTSADQLGVELPVGVPAATVQGGAIQQLGGLTDGLYTTAGFLSSTTETNDDVDEFLAAMEQHEPKAYVSDLSANAYVGVQIIAEVLADATTIDAATLKAALDSTTDLDLGLITSVDFTTESAFPGMPRMFNSKVIQARIEDEQLIALGGFVDVLTGQ